MRALLFCFSLAFVLAAVPPGAAAEPGRARVAGADSSRDVRAELAALPPFDRDEVLWLARCIYSESDRVHEQRHVAWVVRNRVETHFAGDTYREVVLERRQFSAFNAPTPRRERILRLGPESPSLSWRRALEVAYDVYRAAAEKRPFAQTVRHFYSPVSMPGGQTPHWAEGETPLASADLGVDPHRFLFFDGIDEGGDPARATLAGVEAEAPPSAVRFRPRLSISTRIARPSRPSVRRPTRGGG